MYHPDRSGFTLVEVLIVSSLVVIAGTFALFASMDAFYHSSFRSDHDLLIAALQRARALSINNVCDGYSCTDSKPHGVSIQTLSYVVFQGSSYAMRDAAVDAVFETNPNVTHAGLSEVVFSQLAGTTSTTGDIVLTNEAGQISTTTITGEGQIVWTH